MWLCEKHVQWLEKYRGAIQGPNGDGVQPVVVQVAILLDAMAVTDRGVAPSVVGAGGDDGAAIGDGDEQVCHSSPHGHNRVSQSATYPITDGAL